MTTQELTKFPLLSPKGDALLYSPDQVLGLKNPKSCFNPLSSELDWYTFLLCFWVNFSKNTKALAHKIETSKDETIAQVRHESDRVIVKQREEIDSLRKRINSQKEQLEFLYEQEQARKAEQEKREYLKERVKNRTRQTLRDGATFPELSRSLEEIDSRRYKSEYAKSRDIVALLLLFFTGLRVSNLRLLTSNNLSSFLDASHKSLNVRLIKTGARVEPLRIHLDKSCHELALQYEYHFVALQHGKHGDDFVFTRENAKEPLERAWLTNRLNAILKVTGKELKKKLSTHSFRIGQVNNLISVFGIEGAKRMIGHQSIVTTSRYARGYTDSRELDRGMRKVEKLKYQRLPRSNSRLQKEIRNLY